MPAKPAIHPDLKKQTFFLSLIPPFSELTYRVTKKMTGLIKGKRPSKGMRLEQVIIPRADGKKLRLCVYIPAKPKEDVPGLLWLHGGGYGLGVPEQEEKTIARFVESSGCVVVSPDYRLSIEAPYPAAIDDCYSALLWLRDNAKKYGIRPDQLFVGGESAGGGLAAALALQARDRKEVSIAFQIPLYPMIDDRMSTPSAKGSKAPLWNHISNFNSWKLYLGDLFESPDVPCYAAPARAEDLSSLPPACSFVGGIEAFRDETVSYFQRLKESGVPTHFKIYPGCFHGFDMLFPNAAVSKDAHEFLMASFRHAVKHYFAPQP
ncbi:MAG: alpha/beta hydrolase, partial [Clostridiales bacterium]|nr:alpha/beta hydrolase [Clostridiales bacterium]